MSKSGSLVSSVTEAPAASGCAMRGGAAVGSWAGLLLLLELEDEDCACMAGTSANPTPRTTAVLSSFRHSVESDKRDDIEEKVGVDNKDTINSTLPWSLGEQQAGCNLCTGLGLHCELSSVA